MELKLAIFCGTENNVLDPDHNSFMNLYTVGSLLDPDPYEYLFGSFKPIICFS